jgi:hypothetical protein
MLLGWWAISVTLTLSNEFNMHTFILLYNMEGNLSNSGKIFTSQMKIIRIMAGAQLRTSCISLFKQSEITPVPCQYILSLTNFIINKHENFQTNSSIHSINTRNKHHLHKQMPTFLNVTYAVNPVRISLYWPTLTPHPMHTRSNIKYCSNPFRSLFTPSSAAYKTN